MVALLKDAKLETIYAKPLGQALAHNLHPMCVWLLLWNECLRPWRKGSRTGQQSMALFQPTQSQSVSRLKKKSLKFGILLLLYIQGGKSSSFQDFA